MPAMRHQFETLPAFRGSGRPVARKHEETRWSEERTMDEEGIPGMVYAHILNSSATVPRSVRYRTLANMLVQQALSQLAPTRRSVYVQIVRCMPPQEDGKIRTLRGSIGFGFSPWDYEMEQQAILLGRESVAGSAVSSRRLVCENVLASALGTEPLEMCAVACPITYSTAIAGCLLVGSSDSDFFVPERLMLIQRYAELLALAFEIHEFYDADALDLQLMPERAVQLEYLSSYRQRISGLGRSNSSPASDSSLVEAVWQLYERDFLLMRQFAPSFEEYSR